MTRSISVRSHRIEQAALRGDAQAPNQGMPIDRRALLSATLSAVLLAGSAERAYASPLAPAATVLVVGATGQTGRRLVSELRARGFKVKAGVRDIKKARGMGIVMDDGVTLVEADVLKPAQLAAAAAGVDAIVCATGYNGFNPSGFGDVDETGTKNLVDAAKAAGVPRFVLLSSLLTNAPAVGQAENPNYKFLNIFGAVLDHKLSAERYLRGSGMVWTVVRPGGLSNDPASKVGNLIVGGEDTLFGLDNDPGREISRDTVAQVLAASLQTGAAENKVFEIVSALSVKALPEDKWFDV
ncbi:hypothetical protein FOA52_002666 [Chlamydomonas sp. UWO 241]|nr:hypothetical protein FOA52_002666 [Chlamydomonas sp. UWO 241]